MDFNEMDKTSLINNKDADERILYKRKYTDENSDENESDFDFNAEEVIIENSVNIWSIILVQLILCLIIAAVIMLLKYNKQDVYSKLMNQMSKTMKDNTAVRDYINDAIIKIRGVLNV